MVQGYLEGNISSFGAEWLHMEWIGETSSMDYWRDVFKNEIIE